MRNLSIAEADMVFGGQVSSSQTASGGSPGTTTTTTTTSRGFTIGATFDGSGNATGIRISYTHSSGGSAPVSGGGNSGGGGMGGGGGNGIVHMDVIEINQPSNSSKSDDRLADLAGLY